MNFQKEHSFTLSPVVDVFYFEGAFVEHTVLAQLLPYSVH